MISGILRLISLRKLSLRTTVTAAIRPWWFPWGLSGLPRRGEDSPRARRTRWCPPAGSPHRQAPGPEAARRSPATGARACPQRPRPRSAPPVRRSSEPANRRQAEPAGRLRTDCPERWLSGPAGPRRSPESPAGARPAVGVECPQNRNSAAARRSGVPSAAPPAAAVARRDRRKNRPLVRVGFALADRQTRRAATRPATAVHLRPPKDCQRGFRDPVRHLRLKPWGFSRRDRWSLLLRDAGRTAATEAVPTPKPRPAHQGWEGLGTQPPGSREAATSLDGVEEVARPPRFRPRQSPGIRCGILRTEAWLRWMGCETHPGDTWYCKTGR